MTKESVCNYCGKTFDMWDEFQDFSMNKRISYGSEYDGELMVIKFCCDCMDRIINRCAESPIVDDKQG